MYVSPRYEMPVLEKVFESEKPTTNEQRKQIAVNACLYILREINFNKAFRKSKTREEAAKLRSAINDFDIIVRLKLAILKCCEAKATMATAPRIFVRCGLTIKDAWIWEYVREAQMPKVKQFIKTRPLLALPEKIVDMALDIVYNGSVAKALYSLVRSKMTFIANSQNIALSDLYSDVMMKAVETFYVTFPFLSENHVKPSIVNSCNNHIIKMIRHFTSHKRAQIIGSDNGEFQQLVVSLQDTVGEDNNVERNWFAAVDDRSESIYENSERVVSLEKFRRKKNYQKAIDAILGRDKEFLDRIADNTGIRIKGAGEAFDELGQSKFFNEVRKYANLTPKNWRDMLGEIRGAA